MLRFISVLLETHWKFATSIGCRIGPSPSKQLHRKHRHMWACVHSASRIWFRDPHFLAFQRHLKGRPLWELLITNRNASGKYTAKWIIIYAHYKTEIKGRGESLRWPRDTLYPLKLTLTSPTSGGRSVGIVRWRTEAPKFFFVLEFN
jgi:hypothetical protein